MKHVLQTIKTGITALAIIACTFAPSAYATSYPVGGQQYYLSGAGITSSATTIALTSLKTPDGTAITMAMVGSIGYGALEPQTSSKIENITFSGITQNANGTASLTGVTRGIAFTTPYAATASLRQSHSGGSTFIITNTASFLGNEFAFTNNPSAITNYWTFPTPLASANPATKGYVDSVVSGGTVTTPSITVVGNAGETVAAGNVLFFQTSDARWYKAGLGTAEASSTILGISEGAGTTGNAITGGILLAGSDSNQSGLTAGKNYFLGSTAGTISTATSTRSLGKASTATTLYFSPYFLGASVVPANTNSPTTFNGVQLNFPAAQATASSTVFANDGTGNTYWVNQPINTLLVNSALNVSTSNTSTTTLSTLAIPANTLGTNKFLRVTGMGNQTAVNGTCFFGIDFGSGTATTTQVAFGGNSGTTGQYLMPIQFNTSMYATSTSAQVWVASAPLFTTTSTGFVSLAPIVGEKFGNINLAAATYLAVNAAAISPGTCVLNNLTVEVVSK